MASNPSRAGTALAACLAAVAAWSVLAFDTAHAQISLDDYEDRMVAEDRGALESRRIARADADRAAALAARRAGIVYRNARFWSRLPAFDTGRALFDGRFEALAARDFEDFFVKYHDRWSADCTAQVSAVPHATFHEYSQRVRKNSAGVVEWEGPKQLVNTIRVEQRYAPAYRRFRESRESDPGALLEMLADAGAALQRGETPFLSLAYAHVATYTSLAKFNANGCSSPLAFQLRENLRRFLEGEPSLQDAGGVVPGAAAASDPPPARAEFMTLEGACLAHHMERSRDWCACIDTEALRTLSIDEYQLYAESYEQFQRARGGASGRVSAADRVASRCTK